MNTLHGNLHARDTIPIRYNLFIQQLADVGLCMWRMPQALTLVRPISLSGCTCILIGKSPIPFL